MAAEADLLVNATPVGTGSDEDARGEPFVGRAGKKLDEMIAAIGLRREDGYIANIVKCRPPRNRDPEPEEQTTCGPFLERQLEIIAPEVIVTLGAVAAVADGVSSAEAGARASQIDAPALQPHF